MYVFCFWDMGPCLSSCLSSLTGGITKVWEEAWGDKVMKSGARWGGRQWTQARSPGLQLRWRFWLQAQCYLDIGTSVWQLGCMHLVPELKLTSQSKTLWVKVLVSNPSPAAEKFPQKYQKMRWGISHRLATRNMRHVWFSVKEFLFAMGLLHYSRCFLGFVLLCSCL